MKLVKITSFLIFIFYVETSSHLCHDPFIPREHLVLVPEEKIIKIEKSGKFRIYIENTFNTTLHRVKLIVENPAFDIKVEPEEINKLVPNERSFYTVKLSLKDKMPEGEYPLKIDVKAESAILQPQIRELTVTTVKPEEEIFPEIKEPIEQEDLSLPSEERKKEIEKRQPTPVKEPVQIKEPSTPAPSGIIVQVERKRFVERYLLYLCGIIIVVLFTIFIWRKLKGK